MSELAVNPELDSRFQETFLAVEQAGFAEIIERAVARGELAGPVDPAMAHLTAARIPRGRPVHPQPGC